MKPQVNRMVFALVLAALGVLGAAVRAQTANPFENGWTLDSATSELRFMSVKKGNVVESNRFTTLSGVISEQGLAQIRVLLDSVDTGIDLRNVRMRFLLFETFLHPEATITTQLDASRLADLGQVRRKVIDLDFAISLHGMTVNRSAEVAVTLLNTDRVVVSTTSPIAITLPEFDLDNGRQKLEGAAGVSITPVGIVSFDFVFDRAGPGAASDVATPAAPDRPEDTAAPAGAELDRSACIDRLERLSRSGKVFFSPASDRLDDRSHPLLDKVFDLLGRCPGLAIEIAGHTDADGAAQWNRTLSQKRAAAVAAYLGDKGIDPGRMQVVGHGETRPLVPNTSAQNKARNRRIEFSAID